MLKNMNKGTKLFVIVYAVCWIISAITCAIVYFRWFSEAMKLQKRTNAVIERDIFKEVFDDINASRQTSNRSCKWDLPDVNNEEEYSEWLSRHEDDKDEYYDKVMRGEESVFDTWYDECRRGEHLHDDDDEFNITRHHHITRKRRYGEISIPSFFYLYLNFGIQ